MRRHEEASLPSGTPVRVHPVVGTNGTGAFLKDALGIYITPLHVIEALEGKKPFDAKPLLANPPWSTVRLNDQAQRPLADSDAGRK